jgi:hypothetical protein
MTWFNDVHSDKKDVSCSWEIAVKCGGQGADLVGAVGGHMKKGRRATGWCSAPHMPTVGTAYDIGQHGREAWRSQMDQASGECGLHRPWSALHRKTWQAQGLHT